MKADPPGFGSTALEKGGLRSRAEIDLKFNYMLCYIYVIFIYFICQIAGVYILNFDHFHFSFLCVCFLTINYLITTKLLKSMWVGS